MFFDIFIDMETRKIKISLTIDIDIDKQLNEEKINKSRLINWLLKKHYDDLKIGGVK